ncbi:hypothetical protein D3C81_1246850 [compost metagenome]
MVGSDAGYHLFLQRQATGVIVVTNHFHHRVVGLRTGVGKENLAHRHRRQRDELLREIHGRLMRFVSKGVVER